MKRKLSRWVRTHLNVDAIKMVILFVPLVYLLIKEIGQGEFLLESFLEVDILVSFLLVAKAIAEETKKRFIGAFSNSQ